jgi:hypothetical protein
VVVAPHTDGPVVVAPRTYGPLVVVATRAINASNKTLKKGTTAPQRQLPPGFRRLGEDLQLVPRPAARPAVGPVDPQTPPPDDPDFPPFEPPLPPSSPGDWSDDGSQEKSQLEHEQLPDGNVDLANGNYTFNSSCSIVPDNCAPVADTAVTSNAIASSNAITSSNIIGQPNNDATDTLPAVVPHKKARRPAKDKVSAPQQPNVGRTTRGATAASKKRTATEAGLDETGDGVNTDLTAPAKRITRRTNQGAL